MKQITKKLSVELELPQEVIEKTYKAFWLFIKTKIESLPLMEDLNEEEFNALRQNFNIPNLGKLYCNKKDYNRIKTKYKKSKNASYAKYKENKTNG